MPQHCPRCGHDLPAPYAPARAAAFVAGALQASIQVAAGTRWQLLALSVLASAVLIGTTAAFMIFVWRNYAAHEEAAPELDWPRMEDVHVAGGIRVVSRSAHHVRWLREKGFHVPAEPERGALSRWLYAVLDGDARFSQTGARETLRDTSEIRQWASAILALFAHAGWCEPRNGWDAGRPDLGNGVDDVDMDVLREVARTGQSGLISRLVDVVEDDLKEVNDGMDNG